MKIKVKKLELKDERPFYKKLLASKQAKRTILFVVLGAIGGFLYFYFTEGQHMNEVLAGDIIQSSLIGAGFGVFITNSPCARGRC